MGEEGSSWRGWEAAKYIGIAIEESGVVAEELTCYLKNEKIVGERGLGAAREGAEEEGGGAECIRVVVAGEVEPGE